MSFLESINEIKDKFKHEETQINNIILKQVIEYIFPIFACDLETCNLEIFEYCEAYAAGVYHPNILY